MPAKRPGTKANEKRLLLAGAVLLAAVLFVLLAFVLLRWPTTQP